MFKSLFVKISVSVGVVITLTLTFFAFYVIQDQKEDLLQARQHELETFSNHIYNGLMALMREGRGADIHRLLQFFEGQENGLPLRILDSQGKVLHSSRREERGSAMGYLLQGKELWEGEPKIFEQEIAGRTFLSSLRAFRNEPYCSSCHTHSGKIIGVLHVAFPLGPTMASIGFHRNILIAAAAMTLIFMALTINWLLLHFVKKPVERLVEAMSRVEKGDLDVQLNIDTGDELGRVARHFGSMTRHLSRAQRELKKQHEEKVLQYQNLASLGELAAGVVHEVKNPLAGIKLAIQSLTRNPGFAAPREDVKEILRSIERLDHTMADLLSYSQSRPPLLKSANIHNIIEGALFAVRDLLRSAGVRVEKRYDPSLPLLPLDADLIGRALLNLFLNALQAMPGGGVLTIETRHCAADPTGGNETSPVTGGEGWAQVAITDTGNGIPQEILGEIFRPFFTTKAKGTGLGLALTKRIIEQHQGQIYAQNQVGAGTRFCLSLPTASGQGGFSWNKKSS